MNRNAVELVPAKRRGFGRRGAVEVVGVKTRPDDHFTRLWPSDDTDALYRIVMLPIRVVALLILWATSSPGRSGFAFIVAAAVTAYFLL
ncbi:hypothetical protein [Allonocardiopsis opalescens]|uniref:Uncharacterized protein n=1 Tax=Allonocardiopsis opalescens TaxID=1144618 RepID=A0A2T0Q2Y7_9ACTN|nr:hypothetical protein [Allonocardiopsis opalescens]PRX98167.1 hypothetical protein CLV72_105520 [Allonocardiopsis opalescens]